MLRLLCFTIAIASCSATALAAQEQPFDFQHLPKEVRDLAVEVRNSCRELDSSKAFSDMQGIEILDLSGDGSRGIFVDNEGLCGGRMAGANCSNRGCDMTIFKEVAKGRWRQIFKEHLY